MQQTLEDPQETMQDQQSSGIDTDEDVEEEVGYPGLDYPIIPDSVVLTTLSRSQAQDFIAEAKDDFNQYFPEDRLQPFRIRLIPVVVMSSLPAMFQLNSTIAHLILNVALCKWIQMGTCTFAKFLGIAMVVFMVN